MAEGFKILDAYVEVRADASGVGAEAERQIRSQSSRFSSAGSSIGSGLMGGLQGVIGGLVGGVVSAFAVPLVQGVNQAISSVMATAKTAIFDYNTALENANIGFTTMLGSSEKATKMLGDLQKFAATTPFEFSDLTLASQRLIAMGTHAKDVIPTMTAIGDAVAGLGGDKGTIDQITTAIGQMTAKGKIQGDELMQLTEAGIPALKILADTYHVSTGEMSDMISAGKVLSDKAVPAIVKGLEQGTKTTKGFGGMMAAQSKTMAGSLSNIQDSINQTLSKAFLPMFKVVERVAGSLAKFAGSKQVTEWARDTSANVGKFLGQLERAVKAVFGDPKVQKAAQSLFANIQSGIKDSGPALKDFLPNLVTFGKEILPDILGALNKVAKRIPDFVAAAAGIGTILTIIGPSIGDFIGWLTDIALLLIDVPKKAAQMTYDLMQTFYDLGMKIGKVVNTLPAQLAEMGRNIVQGLIDGITSQGKLVLDTVHNLADSVASGFRAALGIQSPSKVFQKYGGWVGEGLSKGLLGSVDQIKSAGSALADAVDKSAVAGIERVTKRLEVLSKRRQAVIDRLATAKDALSGLRDDRATYKQGVRDSVMGAGDITSLFEAGTSSTTTTAAASGALDGRTYTGSYTTSSTSTSVGGLSGVRAKLRALVTSTKTFTANLKKLVGMGLDHFSVQELIQAGPTVSLPITTELLNDKAGFNDLVSLQRQLNQASTGLGEYGAGYTYDSKIASAASTVNRLRDRRDNITAVMIVEARKIDEVDKVVKAVNALAKTAKAKKASVKK